MQESGSTARTAKTQISLLRGQAHYAHLSRGTVISVTVGALSVKSRIWLEHDVLTVQTPVDRGGMYRVPASCWCELAAQSDVVLCLLMPASLSPWRAGAPGWATPSRLTGWIDRWKRSGIAQMDVLLLRKRNSGVHQLSKSSPFAGLIAERTTTSERVGSHSSIKR